MTTATTGATVPQKLPWFPWIGKKRPFYGWVIVAAGMVTQFTQGIVSQGFGTYFIHLQKDFGWSRAVLAGPNSIMQVENAILGPLEGFLMDRLGPRVMVAIGVIVMGVGLILFGLAQNLWMYYLSNIIIALGTGFQGLLILSIAVNVWFKRKRTLANAVMLLGFAMAGVVGIPALVFAQTNAGWRGAAIITGIAVMAVGLPLSTFLRRSPEHHGLLPDGDTPATAVSATRGRYIAEEYDFTLREALRTRTFWFLAGGIAVGNLGMAAVGTHLYLHLEQGVGLSRTTAAFVWSVASMTNIPCRLLGGFIGDRLPKYILLAIATALMSLSSLILAWATSLPMALAYAVIYGIGWGARTPVLNAIQGEYFGRKSQGVIRGWLAALALPITIAAPVIVGLGADIQGTYTPVFTLMSLIGLSGSALIFLAKPPKIPVHKGLAP